MPTLLIANRGEIAIRIAAAAREMGMATLAIYAADDAASLHIRAADIAVALPGEGPAAYLDIAAIIAIAQAQSCDLIAPGYGFLSENADFSTACRDVGITFVGPSPAALTQFGDKARAKALAEAAGVPILAGPQLTGDLAQDAVLAQHFLARLPDGGGIMIKAVAGGGGRGIRLVRHADEIAHAMQTAASEAEAGFGSGALLVERYVERARHIEVQVIADATGAVLALGERDCSIQRRHQKLVEITPAPQLSDTLRQRFYAAAEAVIGAAPYQGLATVEFLLDCDADPDSAAAFAFMEVNPRLQVEHTITEQVTGIDLVTAAIRIAQGATLADLGLTQRPSARGHAIELRINAETLDENGQAWPASGAIGDYIAPSGPGIRVDGMGYSGYPVSPRYDPLIAKLIAHADSYPAMLARAERALGDFTLTGIASSLPLLAQVITHPDIAAGQFDTGWFARSLRQLLAALPPPEIPLHDHSGEGAAPEGSLPILADMPGVIVSHLRNIGDKVVAGEEILLLEALKMQHPLLAHHSGILTALPAGEGAQVQAGQVIAYIRPDDSIAATPHSATAQDPEHIRADLADLRARHALGHDTTRGDAVTKRRKTGQRTARENLDDLFDAGSFAEYGALAIAAQRRRRSVEDLMANTPADGLVGGIGTVNAAQFGPEAARVMGLSYDYMVLAGTQGYINHHKTDRLLDIAAQGNMPVVFYTEGGGGRPGDVDAISISGLNTPSFAKLASLSGKVPRIAIASGYCFAGNAVMFGVCDITIATRRSFIGLGGPAMIEGGGLGVFRPEEIGPSEIQSANGVIDLLVEDEAEATAAARALLGIFQGRIADSSAPDQRLLRHIIPENRKRVYDMRGLIAGLVDDTSFIELRHDFGRTILTGFARIDGYPVGIMANDPHVLSGAIDSDGADKAARFMQLCDAFAIPIVSLCDTPGFMVGPDSEATAAVRHGSRMFVAAASLSVPVFCVVVRRGYGLGAQAMAAGSFTAPFFTIAWPSGEFGGMGLEGAVRLGYRKELEAIADPIAREARYQELVAASYDRGKAVSVAQILEVDAVIDPADTRAWLLRGLQSTLTTATTANGPRFIDTW